jgi:hypothetical protein
LSDRLRYKIGKVKEEVLPEVRNKNPWGAFSAFNFAIEAELLKHITFDESLVEYGHEDTLFGLELRHRCIEVCHVFNPAYHLGIDEDVAFMEKTRRGVDNLAALIELGKIDEEVTLYKAYLNAQKTGIIGLLKWNVSWLEPWLFNRLALGKGPLFLFDLYKLLRLSKGITSTPRKNF